MIPVSTAHPLQNAQPPPLAMAVFPADEFNATNSSWNSNQNPEYVLVHYLNTETEINLKSAIDKISACIKLNSLNLNKQQLLDQVSPIYANMLCQQDIATLCEEICNMLQNAQQNELDTTATGPSSVMEPNSISYITHSALHRLERRNSCSSEFRHGLSSSALRRQPSTYSDCLDVIHGGASVINNTVEGKLSRETCTGYSADGRSHSCETYGSSNQDEEGGTKALIVGGWYMKGHNYSVMFGEKSVLARLVQVGVLSLIVPPRSVCGVVPVRVLCNGHVISTSVDFTYINDRDEVTMSSLRQCMVDRLHFIAHAFGASDKLEWVTPVDENSILSLLRSLTTFHLSMPSILSTHPSLPSRTILHIAAALNYDKVIECVLAWRHKLLFSREFDPLARDCEGRTPLHVAVAAGHVASARVLVRACRTTVDVLDDRGRTPCDLSRDEQMIRLTARSVDHDFEEQRTLPKKVPLNVTIGICLGAEDVEHVTSTALWVLTNGETVTDEHLLRDQPPTVAEDSSSTILSESPNRSHNHSTPGTNKLQEKWCNEPLHVEISMDTDVYVPDSPKMADLFEAVTRQVFNVV
uniref:ANK_REP_REGION domain-containing protein n=1 Tax=Angiostrongylus cantonensis TaxID=6313 RepID=A0A0K0CWI6_ANGCA